MNAWRRRWDLFLGALLGFPCAVTGERTFPKDRAGHERDQHGTDGACA